MNEITVVGYDELEDLLQSAGAECGAAESHGVLCGIICAAARADSGLWLEHLLGEGNTLSAMAQASHDKLQELYSETLLHLNGADFSLELLLPDDALPLTVRSRAIGEWCQGFLYGLALGGVREDQELPGNVGEIMADLYEISDAGFAEESTDEDDESAYLEIVEYVRMCVLLCHDELQPLQPPGRLQ